MVSCSVDLLIAGFLQHERYVSTFALVYRGRGRGQPGHGTQQPIRSVKWDWPPAGKNFTRAEEFVVHVMLIHM